MASATPSRVGFLSASLRHSFVTVPISFLDGMQIGLVRSIEDLTYMPVATTGNLMRLVEAGHDAFIEKQSADRRPFWIYAGLIGSFAGGAIAGAFATRALGPHAIWVPAGLVAATLVLFVIDERPGKGGLAGCNVVEPTAKRVWPSNPTSE